MSEVERFRYETKDEYETAISDMLKELRKKENASSKEEDEYDDLLEEYLRFRSDDE